MTGRSVLVFSSCYSQGVSAFEIQAVKQNHRFGLIKSCAVKTVSYSFVFITIVVSVSASQHDV